jgi:hypothetical protein
MQQVRILPDLGGEVKAMFDRDRAAAKQAAKEQERRKCNALKQRVAHGSACALHVVQHADGRLKLPRRERPWGGAHGGSGQRTFSGQCSLHLCSLQPWPLEP